MGNLFAKCKECLVFLRPKPITVQPSHQLVNLSNNPAEESQGKIEAQQISFTQEVAQSNDQTITQSGETNVNDVTLEVVDNKQLSALRSPQTNQNPNANEQNQFILNEECKTDPSLESPALISFKKPGIATYATMNHIPIQELAKCGRESLDQFLEYLEQGYTGYEFQNNTKNIDLYFSHYQIGKRTMVQIKFDFNINGDINRFLQWSNSNKLFDFDLIQSYSLQPLSEQVSVGEIIIKKHMMIKNQILTYLKYLETYNQDYYIIFKSIRLDDRYNSLNISDRADQLSEGEIVLAGLKIVEKNGQLNIQGYIEADFLIKVGFNLATKKLREIGVNLITKVKSLFD